MVPPGGWVYIQHDTEFRVEGTTFIQLVSKVMTHREYKEIEPLEYSAVAKDVEQQICDRNKDNYNIIRHD